MGGRDAGPWGRQWDDVHSEHAGEELEGNFFGAATPVCLSASLCDVWCVLCGVWCVSLSLCLCEREMALSLGAICASSCGLLGVCVCVCGCGCGYV